MNMSGNCLCGSVKYTYSDKVLMAGNCHCLDCKKASGSGYASRLFVPENLVEITGEVKYYASISSSGTKVSRGFCPDWARNCLGDLERCRVCWRFAQRSCALPATG